MRRVVYPLICALMAEACSTAAPNSDIDLHRSAQDECKPSVSSSLNPDQREQISEAVRTVKQQIIGYSNSHFACFKIAYEKPGLQVQERHQAVEKCVEEMIASLDEPGGGYLGYMLSNLSALAAPGINIWGWTRPLSEVTTVPFGEPTDATFGSLVTAHRVELLVSFGIDPGSVDEYPTLAWSPDKLMPRPYNTSAWKIDVPFHDDQKQHCLFFLRLLDEVVMALNDPNHEIIRAELKKILQPTDANNPRPT